MTIDEAAAKLGVTLNAGQRQAIMEILESIERGRMHLLTGWAGTGKTTLLQVLAIMLLANKMQIVLTAPTHKAVQVIRRKLEARGVVVACATVASLLSLVPKPKGDRLVFTRSPRAEPVTADVVWIDECSMLDADIMAHIRRHLPNSAVIFSGDPAQLPPVGETISESFATKHRSHLTEIVRQGADNPILAVTEAIRALQGGEMDWSWMKPARNGNIGVFLPRDADAWMKTGFTSPEFEADADTFRYLAWTNERVAHVNARVRAWRYGDVSTPFVVGEHALLRSPIVRAGAVLAATNEEPEVLSIERADHEHIIKARGGLGEWTAKVPSWRVTLRTDMGATVETNLIDDERIYNRVTARITEEARENGARWADYHAFKEAFTKAQSIYAMTCHCAQGSTLRHVFVDVADIGRRARTNTLECLKLLYVAASRPTDTLNFVGAR